MKKHNTKLFQLASSLAIIVFSNAMPPALALHIENIHFHAMRMKKIGPLKTNLPAPWCEATISLTEGETQSVTSTTTLAAITGAIAATGVGAPYAAVMAAHIKNQQGVIHSADKFKRGVMVHVESDNASVSARTR